MAKEHLVNVHPMEVEVMDEEVRSTMPLPRKRGPRGPGRRGRKSRRENSQGQDLQGKGTQSQEQNSHLGKESNHLEGVAGQGQGLQVEENEQQDSGKGNGIKLESLAGRARLPRRKRLYKQLMKLGKKRLLFSGLPVKRRALEKTLTQGPLRGF